MARNSHSIRATDYASGIRIGEQPLQHPLLHMAAAQFVHLGSRMKGEGVWAQLLAQRFNKAAARLGLNRQRVELDLTQFRKPRLAAPGGQGELFD